MKIKKISSNKKETSCCETTTESKKLCRDQPVDNTPCCDKSNSKKTNSEKTGCC